VPTGVGGNNGLKFSHIYVPKPTRLPCCAELVGSLQSDSRYELIYDGPGALIFATSDSEGRRHPVS